MLLYWSKKEAQHGLWDEVTRGHTVVTSHPIRIKILDHVIIVSQSGHDSSAVDLNAIVYTFFLCVKMLCNAIFKFWKPKSFIFNYYTDDKYKNIL